MVPGLGLRKAGLLIEKFKTPVRIFRASRSELEACGLAGGIAQTVTHVAIRQLQEIHWATHPAKLERNHPELLVTSKPKKPTPAYD